MADMEVGGWGLGWLVGVVLEGYDREEMGLGFGGVMVRGWVCGWAMGDGGVTFRLEGYRMERVLSAEAKSGNGGICWRESVGEGGGGRERVGEEGGKERVGCGEGEGGVFNWLS